MCGCLLARSGLAFVPGLWMVLKPPHDLLELNQNIFPINVEVPRCGVSRVSLVEAPPNLKREPLGLGVGCEKTRRRGTRLHVPLQSSAMSRMSNFHLIKKKKISVVFWFACLAMGRY